MLCEACVWMLRGRRGQKFGGTLSPQFVHHDSAESFWASVAQNCSICRALGDKVGANIFAAVRRMPSAHESPFLDLHSQANLSAVPSASDDRVPVYRLDFTVEWAGIKFRHTFVLRPISFKDNVESLFRTPVSDQMYHAEVLGLVNTWLNRCTCVGERKLTKEDYPTRLINLAELKMSGTIDAKKWIYHEDVGLEELGDRTVKLVDKDSLDWSKPNDKEYVTLSHKWGGTDKLSRLTKATENVYREGVRLKDLPQTFQDAIHFALRVDRRVHYIWIDSLCILQGDKEDWLKESARMQEVYRNSFLNISATAAEHSDEGLYSHRIPQHLWEEVVRLDIDGLHQGAENPRQESPANTSSKQNEDADTTGTTGPALDPMFNPLAKVQSCLLVDVSNWETLVNQAPVNKRGWVVQERLLAPRVLHFCRGRIAWECAGFDDIEGQVPGIPNYQLIGDEIYEGIPIKGLRPEKHGMRLRLNRLRGAVDRLDLAENDTESKIVYSLELWSRIVEMYCKTDLTEEEDKLIALSGIAHRMANIITESGQGQIQYVAGLWNSHLVSQLLWHVEPVYRGDSDSSSDTIEHLSRRPKHYRAPSFSWASVDAQLGNGVACGHVLESEVLLAEVAQDADDSGSASETEVWKKSVLVESQTPDKFGLVKSGHIRLWARVHHVKLQREGTHYYWFLLLRNGSAPERDKEIENEKKNFNVYLDCPKDDDKENRLVDSKEIYCILMALGPPSINTDIVCLLLEKVPLLEGAANVYQTPDWPDKYLQWTFRRIGYTKLSATFDHFTWNYISKYKPDKNYSDEFYDEETGRHLVCII